MTYDGYEDARTIFHNHTYYLIANHEDCRGRRSGLVLVQLGGSAYNGTLAPVQDEWALSLPRQRKLVRRMEASR